MTPANWRAALSEPRTCPITVKVPLVVALLMLVVSTGVTERVLSRLQTAQEAHLHQLASTYMDGLSAAIMPHVLRHDVWEVFDALDRARHGYKALELISTTVAAPDGGIIASSNPKAFPADTRLGDTFLRKFATGRDVIVEDGAGRAHVRRLLSDRDRMIGGIYSEVSIARLLAERRDVLITLLTTNVLLTLVLAIIGYIAVRRMIRPMKVLSDYLGRGHAGAVEPIPDHLMASSDSSFGRLFVRYNAMARAVNDREALTRRLAEEEKLASLGRLTSAMAHEINNPLGGLFNAIDALKRHGHKDTVRATSVNLLERGLAGIRNVVHTALVAYRADRAQRRLMPSDLDDLRVLLRPEVKRKGIRLEWSCSLDQEIDLPAGPVRDAALNLLLNACAATPGGRTVAFNAERRDGDLELTIRDEGDGLPARTQDYLERQGRGIAPIEDRSGLGLWMVRRLADETGGRITIEPGPRRGTVITLRLPIPAKEALRHVA